MNVAPDQERPIVDRLLERVVNQLPSMVGYWDRDLRCRYANAAYERWLGVEPESLIGMRMPELLGPALFELNRPFIEGALLGEPQVFERDVPGPGGVLRPSLAHYTPDVVDGEVKGFMVEVIETTQLKRAQQAVRDSELRYRTLAESSPFVVFHADVEGQLTYISPRWLDLSGLDIESHLGHRWLQALHPEDRERIAAGWRRGSRELALDCRLVRADGALRQLRLRARAVSAEGQSPAGFVGALEDVTEARLSEERLRKSEAFLRQAGHLSGVGGWEVDLVTGRVSWSEQTRRIHEVTADYEPTVEDGLSFYAPEGRPKLREALDRAVRDGEAWNLELPFVTAKGRPLWVRASGRAERDGAGAAVRLVGAFQDVTDQHQRQEILDVLAHEVRQPLNNASAALQAAVWALQEADAAGAAPRIARAQAVVGRVQADIDNTLAVAALLAGTNPIERQDTDVDTLLAVVSADMPQADRHRVLIERLTETRTASMDMGLMRLALRNLVSNALRYSAAGTPVTLRVEDSDEPLALLIDVIDQGPGIPAAQVKRLFQRGGLGRQPGHGMGLGLYIVRRVMELHRGQATLLANGLGGVTMRLVVTQSPGD